MDDMEFSRAAVIVAYHRAYHAKYDTPKIFDDFLACHLVPEEACSIIEYHMVEALKLYDPERSASCPDQSTALAWMMRAPAAPSMALGRARYTEDSLEQAVGRGGQAVCDPGSGA